MPLSVGQSLPDVPLTVITGDGPEEQSKDQIFGGKKVVLFAVPGAFTPTCNNNHLPGYAEHADAIKAKGVDAIVVLSVNDPFVMTEWRKSSGAGELITFLADGSVTFTKAVDMVLDGSAFGLGIRSLRYAALVEDGTITKLAVEDSPGEAKASGAEAMLAMLDEG